MKVDGITTGVSNINVSYPVNNVRKDIPVENDKTAEKNKAAEKVKADAAKVAGEVYGDVLSKSVDGDLATATRQSLNALSDGLVMPKDNTPTTETTGAEKVTSEDTKAKEEISSLTGYTSSQLDTLYAQGKISRYDYDKEVERREQLKEQQNPEAADKAGDTAQKTAENGETADNKVNNRADNNKADNYNTDITGTGNNKDDKKNVINEDDKKADILEKAIENNNAVTKEMAQLSGIATNTDMTANALNTANENGRTDFMEQILGLKN